MMKATGSTASEWLVTDLRQEKADGITRVSAQVAGSPLWIESSDAKLAPTPEAFASIFLLPALHHNATLILDAPMSQRWMKNAARLTTIYSEWWGYPDVVPVRAEKTKSAIAPTPATASCFTGGIDSFHTLLYSPYSIGTLVFAQGFDIPLDDELRMAAYEKSFREIARETGKQAVLLRTNIRSHPLFASVPWGRTHGGALAALGHFLAGEIGTFIIPASYGYTEQVPWGSSWRTDPYYSSDRLRIIHHGAERVKHERARAVAHNPIARKHLRVCWENLSATGNCSRCEKCVRTMVYLAASGELENYEVFDASEPLAHRIDNLETLPKHLMVLWRNQLFSPLPADVKWSIRKLLLRSRLAHLRESFWG